MWLGLQEGVQWKIIWNLPINIFTQMKYGKTTRVYVREERGKELSQKSEKDVGGKRELESLLSGLS